METTMKRRQFNLGMMAASGLVPATGPMRPARAADPATSAQAGAAAAGAKAEAAAAGDWAALEGAAI